MDSGRRFAQRAAEIPAMSSRLMPTAFVLFCLIVPGRAWASLIILQGALSGGDVENVLFQGQEGVVTTPTAMGRTNVSGHVVTFTEDSTNLRTPASGQARVTTSDGGLFDYLLITLDEAQPMFRFFEANLRVSENARFRVTTAGSGATSRVFGAGSGENRFNVAATGGDYISSILIESLDGNVFADLRQVRAGAFGIENTAFEEGRPLVNAEPSALILLGSGLLGLAWFARRRRLSA
jgi:hypothetical protein